MTPTLTLALALAALLALASGVALALLAYTFRLVAHDRARIVAQLRRGGPVVVLSDDVVLRRAPVDPGTPRERYLVAPIADAPPDRAPGPPEAEAVGSGAANLYTIRVGPGGRARNLSDDG